MVTLGLQEDLICRRVTIALAFLLVALKICFSLLLKHSKLMFLLNAEK